MATNEALVLNGVALNDFTSFMLTSLSMPPPPKKPVWVGGADSDGSLLAGDPTHENRVIEARIAVMPQATMDLALAKIASLVDQFEECERNRNGLALTWVPADATLSAVTFRCLSGEIVDMPIDMAAGWLVKSPEVTVRLTCLPFWEKAEALVGSVTSSAPIITLELTGIGGDVPALGRMVVTDAASQSRRYAAWGMESRWYPTSAPPSLIVDSSGMVTSGYAGVTATRTAAYSGATNNVISATLQPQSQAICGLGNLAHVGEFRPQLRYYASATTIALRLVYQTLDGPFRALSYKVPVAIGFNHVDLGLITVPPAVLGTQRWTGRIEAYSTATGGETFQVDAVWLMPAEQFGRARSSISYSPGTLQVYDYFDSLASGTVLNARVAPLGGTWATAGATTDFAAADAPGSEETMARSTTTDAGVYRQATIGSSVTATEAAVDVRTTSVAALPDQGLIARWVDASNYLRLSLTTSGPYQGAPSVGLGTQLYVRKVIAGVATTIGNWLVGTEMRTDTWYTLKTVIAASGVGSITIYSGSQELFTGQFADAVLATGGTLASGKIGIVDKAGATAVTRYYDRFYSMTPAAEPIVCYSGQTIEFRHDTTIREDSTGTYYGPPPEYVGGRFTIPCAGGPTRKARVAVIARRNDIEVALDDDLVSNATTDSTTVAVYKSERGLVVPR